MLTRHTKNRGREPISNGECSYVAFLQTQSLYNENTDNDDGYPNCKPRCSCINTTIAAATAVNLSTSEHEQSSWLMCTTLGFPLLVSYLLLIFDPFPPYSGEELWDVCETSFKILPRPHSRRLQLTPDCFSPITDRSFQMMTTSMVRQEQY